MAQSAGTRFCAIFELLEHVLLDIEPSDQDIEHNSTLNDDSPVVTYLFLLRSVNSTFASIIYESKKIRRRMLLEAPLPTPTSSTATAFRPLSWFITPKGLSDMLTGSRIERRWFETRLGDMVNVNASQVDALRDHAIEKKHTTYSDSWCEITLLDFDPQRPVTLAFLVGWQNESGKSQSYKVGWGLEYEVHPTLGDFHDICVEILGRGRAEHALFMGRKGSGSAMCCLGLGKR